MKKNIDWDNLGFEYLQTNSYVKIETVGGIWGDIQTCTDPMMSIHVAATALHYGQACFEGLKAFAQKNGGVAIFRPQANALRMIATAQRTVMLAPKEELFVEAVRKVVRDNLDYMPPYGPKASMYIRPLLIGATPRVGIKQADDFIFLVLAMPVGPYYKNGFMPVKALIQDEYDRAAPKGVGHVKVAGNYASGLLGGIDVKKRGFSVDLYLDSAKHEYIDEFGTSNFFGITKDNVYVTPESSSILPSITNASLQVIAADLGLKVERRRVHVSELSEFKEVGACGTAAVITPVYSITWGDKVFTFGKEDQVGEITKKIYTMLQQIQYGEIEDTHGWMVAV